MFSYYGGIDFSGAREPLSNLWSAVGHEQGGRLRIIGLRPHAFRADLGAYVADGWRAEHGSESGRILWGADFPFGLPMPAVAEILRAEAGPDGWERLLEWAADRPADELRGTVPHHHRTPRLTDTGGALPPLDMRIYKQTVEGLRWLHTLRENAEVAILPQAPNANADTALIEVYPSAAAQELGLPKRRVPSRAGEARARAAALRTYLDFADTSLEAIAVTLEDAWDATVACLTAYLCRETLEPDLPAESARQIALEGRIYLPPGSRTQPRRAKKPSSRP